MATTLDTLDPSQSVRDRLFDLIMRRFEAMEPHRAAVIALEQGQDRDPILLRRPRTSAASHRALGAGARQG